MKIILKAIAWTILRVTTLGVAALFCIVMVFLASHFISGPITSLTGTLGLEPKGFNPFWVFTIICSILIISITMGVSIYGIFEKEYKRLKEKK